MKVNHFVERLLLHFSGEDLARIQQFREWRALASAHPHRFRVQHHGIGGGWAFSLQEYGSFKVSSESLWFWEGRVSKSMGGQWSGPPPYPFGWDILDHSRLWRPRRRKHRSAQAAVAGGAQ